MGRNQRGVPALHPPHTSINMVRLLCLSLLLFAACSPKIAEPPTEPRYQPAQLRADFAQLYADLQAAHFDLYARRNKSDFDARYQRMRDELNQPLDHFQAQLFFQRFVAYGRVAHARVDLLPDTWQRYRKMGGKAFPLYVRFVQGRSYVVDDRSGEAAIEEGDELLSVDNQPIQQWLKDVHALVSADNAALRDAQLESRLPVLVWASKGPADQYVLQLRKADNRVLTLTTSARTSDEFLAAGSARKAFFELDWDARVAKRLAGNIAYLRPGPFYDNRPDATSPWDNTAFVAFIDTAFAEFKAHRAQTLLIDLRDNPGGDNSFSDHLLAWIANKPFRFTHNFEIRVSEHSTRANQKRLENAGSDSMSAKLDAAYKGKAAGSLVNFPLPWVPPRAEPFKGRVVVLINRHSYSNAVSVAAIVQDFGFGSLMGEETSDLASTYGAMESFKLAHTGIEVGYPKARILRPSGDSAPRGAIPDTLIETPIRPSSEDEVLNRAIALLQAELR